MDGYDVITFDDEKAGTVVGRDGQFLIVEHGSIFKHRRPLPDAFATPDDEARLVRATVSRKVLESAPELHDGELDQQAAAEHYGLATGFEAPETGGWGELTPDDPAVSAEQMEAETWLTPSSQERAGTRRHLERGTGPNDEGPPSPGITGGDRRRDAS